MSFERAVAAHTAGRLGEAERDYRAVVAKEPRHADAWHLLGVLALQQADPEKGIEFIRLALSISGPQSHYLVNLGLALEAAKRPDDALATLQEAVALDPQLFVAHFALANVLLGLRRGDEAIRHYQQAITLQPGNASAHNNFGNALKDIGKLDEAIASYRHTLLLQPQHVRAHFNLGTVLKEKGHLDEAIQSLLQALSLDPALVEAHLNIGVAFHDLGQLENALAHARRAAELDPRNASVLNNLGAVLRDMGQVDEAMACYAAAVALRPDLAEARHNQGVALQISGREEEALVKFQEAQSVNSAFAEAEQNATLLMLSHGNFTEGWKAYDRRWQWPGVTGRRHFPQPLWQGENDPSGILVWGEQGLGDNILYASMIPDLVNQSRKVVVETDPRLVAVFARSFPEVTVVPQTDPPHSATLRPDIRLQTPTGSLGRWLRSDLGRFPVRASYLKPDQRRQDQYRSELKNAFGNQFLVGISWRSQNARIGKNKSVELQSWADILRTPGVRFVDLQYGETSAERSAIQQQLGIQVAHIPNLDLREDIDGVIALAAACDLVISVSSAVAHLAAAAGCPTWILAPKALGNLWYWMHETIHTPWYLGATIYRQEAFGDWHSVLEKVHEALAVRANNAAVTAN